MKKSLKLVLLGLLFILIFCCSIALGDIVDSGKCGADLTWTLDSNGLLEISGSGAMSNTEYLHWNQGVLIKKVTINSGVTNIVEEAFWRCHNLTSITIPDSVTNIGGFAFFGCSSLASITIPDNVTSIENCTFDSCSSLTSITIPDSVTRIGSGAFDSCSSLTSITIPDSVTNIGEHAFADCSCLTSITIPDSVTNIGECAFSNCSSLASITIPDGVTIIESGAFNDCSSLKSITIPDGVTRIGSGAFRSCESLTSISLPKNADISSDAFEFCKLKKAKINDQEFSLKNNEDFETVCAGKTGEVRYIVFAHRIHTNSINEQTFYNGILIIYGNGATANQQIYDYVARECVAKAYITEGVTRIGNDALSAFYKLGDISIPESLTGFGSYVFSSSIYAIHISSLESWLRVNGDLPNYHASSDGCNLYVDNVRVTDATIPEGITSLGIQFMNLKYINSVTIPEGVTSISAKAFQNCENLTSISIPDSVISIGNNAISGCEKINCVNINSCNSYAYKWAIQQSLRDKIVVANHTGVVEDKAVAPTCTATGLTTGSHCTSCGTVIVKRESIPSLGHTPVIDPAVPATDIVPGLTEGTHCEVCGQILTAQQMVNPLVWRIEKTDNQVTIIQYYGPKMSEQCIPETLDGLPVSAISSGAFPSEKCPNRIYIHSDVKSIASNAFGKSVTVYCNEFSEADYWCDEAGYTKVYTDDVIGGTFYQISLPTTMTIDLGGECELKPYIFPLTGKETVRAASDNPDIVEIDGTKIIARSVGEANVTIRVAGNTGSCKVNVRADPEDFVITDGASSEVYIATKATRQIISQNISPAGAEMNITWSSSNTSVATVSETGLVTAKRPGTATIYATTQNGITRQCEITVCYPPTSASFRNDEYRIPFGAKEKLIVEVQIDGQVYENRTVTFTSSDQELAPVAPDGTFTAIKVGTYSVTALTDNGLSAQTMVHVYCPGHKAKSIPALAATCTEEGHKAGKICTVCGETLSGMEKINALGHDYQIISEGPADVGIEGHQLHQCSRCGDRYTSVVEALKPGYALSGGSVKKWVLMNISPTWDNESDYPFDQTYIIFYAGGMCEYGIVSQSGSLVRRSSSWSIENEKTVYIPGICDEYGMSLQSSIGSISEDGVLGIYTWVGKKTRFCYFVADESTGMLESAYTGTWKADHLYCSSNGTCLSTDILQDYANTTIVIKADKTLTVNGEAGTWNYGEGVFYLDGERNILQLNELGQLTFSLGDGDYLILTKNGHTNAAQRPVLKLPAGTKTVEEEAFLGTAVQEVVIPKGCTKIETYAFANCSRLQVVHIPASVKTIEYGAFEGTNVIIVAPSGSYALTWAENNGQRGIAGN